MMSHNINLASSLALISMENTGTILDDTPCLNWILIIVSGIDVIRPQHVQQYGFRFQITFRRLGRGHVFMMKSSLFA